MDTERLDAPLGFVAAGAATRTTARPRASALTQLATRNAGAALLDYGVRVVVGVVVTPVILRGLGPALFGSWEMLVRLGGYVSATDGRPTEALRLMVSHAQGDSDDDRRRRLVGAALRVWGLLLPLVTGLGAALVFWAPDLLGIDPADAATARLAAGFLVMAMLAGSLAAVPESVLRGLNLGYTRLGSQSALHLVGGVLAALAAWNGLGLAGLGAATLLRALLTGLLFWFIVARRVPWFGASRPHRAEVRTMLGMSLWLTAGDLIAKLVLASDAVILGLVVSPTLVATYVLTGYAARVALGVHVFTAGEAMPGIGGLIGGAEYARARNARRELHTMTWLYITVAGATVLLWNRAFIALWVGDARWAGSAVEMLIVLAAAQTAFIRVDAGLIDAALRPHRRVLVGSAAAAVTLTLAIIGTRLWGMTGLCLGVIAGRGVQSVAYPLLARRALDAAGDAVGSNAPAIGRAAVATAILFVGTSALGRSVAASSWLAFIVAVPLSIAVLTAFAVTVGATPAARRTLRDRFAAIASRGGA